MWSCPWRTSRRYEALRPMVGKRVQFDGETWEAVLAVAREAAAD